MLAIEAGERALEIIDHHLPPIGDPDDVRPGILDRLQQALRAHLAGLEEQIVFKLGEYFGLPGSDLVPIAAQTDPQTIGGRIFEEDTGVDSLSPSQFDDDDRES